MGPEGGVTDCDARQKKDNTFQIGPQRQPPTVKGRQMKGSLGEGWGTGSILYFRDYLK